MKLINPPTTKKATMNAIDTMNAVVTLSSETIRANRQLVDRAAAFHARLLGGELVRQAVALMSHDESEASRLLDAVTAQVSAVADFATALRLVMSAQGAS